jgi:Zn-finger nucleic acid-binding protein
MKCPICEVDLTMSERQGIEIDYCPKCRGVWLDRGELDKIIERSLGQVNTQQVNAPQAITPPPESYSNRYGHDEHDHHHSKHGYDDRHGHDQRKRSFFSDLFD